MRVPSYEPLDSALDGLSNYGPQLVNGNFNHAPMVAEALCALGGPDAVMPWIERYRDRMVARRPMGEAVRPAEWREALGQRGTFAAWSALFAAELREDAWPKVLGRWGVRLAPGVSGAATHGAIRAGHAVRALGKGESPSRLRELADALASWAASYAELPAAGGAAGGAGGGGLSPHEAIAKVAIVPPERRRSGNITDALKGLGEFPEFAPVIGLVDLDGDIAGMLAELTELFTRLYLANVRDGLTAIVFIHGVTSLAALGHLVPHLDDRAARTLLRYGWQAGCGLYACYGSGPGVAREVAAGAADADSLVDAALANGDEHVIKFTEACLSRHELAPSPVYPAAIGNVLGMIGRR